MKRKRTKNPPNKAKKLRQKWWRSLTPEQQGQQIIKWQAQKAKRRENIPLIVQKPLAGYPWLTEGVNDTNRAEWWAMILKKNPWLKVA